MRFSCVEVGEDFVLPGVLLAMIWVSCRPVGVRME